MPTRFCSALEAFSSPNSEVRPELAFEAREFLTWPSVEAARLSRDHNRNHIVQADRLGIGAQAHQPALRAPDRPGRRTSAACCARTR